MNTAVIYGGFLVGVVNMILSLFFRKPGWKDYRWSQFRIWPWWLWGMLIGIVMFLSGWFIPDWP